VAACTILHEFEAVEVERFFEASHAAQDFTPRKGLALAIAFADVAGAAILGQDFHYVVVALGE
jgi:hypothetical protein